MDINTHHAGDIGRILKSVQDELVLLKSSLLDTGSSKDDKRVQSLKSIIDRAEMDLKAKAEAVLSSTFSDNFTVLPAIRREQPVLPRRPLSATGGGRSRTIGYSSAADAASNMRQADLISKPTSQEARDFLEKRFGVPAPVQSKRRKHKTPTGRLHKTYTCPPAQPLPYINRIDAAAPLPEVHPNDAQNGVFGLIQKGLVPKGADATAAFVVTPAPVLCGPVTLHKFEEQFKKVEVATGLGFPISNLKLDIITKGPLPTTAQRQRMFGGGPTQSPVVLHTTVDIPTFVHVDYLFSEQRLDLPSRPQDSLRTSVAVASADNQSNPALQLPVSSSNSAPVSAPTSAPVTSAAWQSEEARGYNELLDSFSLHQFIIRRGKTLSDTPEYESFKRKYLNVWGGVTGVIRALEKMLEEFTVPVAYIDGNRVVTLARDLIGPPSNDELLSCIVNIEQVQHLVKLPGARYKGSNAKGNAALRIQSVFRGFTARTLLQRVLKQLASIRIIQQWARMLQTWSRARASVVAARATAWKEHCDTQRIFQKQWPQLCKGKRVVIHIPSLSRAESQRISTNDFSLRENGQMSRLTWAADPNVDVVYVSPFPLSKDVLQYYAKLLGITGDSEVTQRFKVVHPENFSRFPSHFSLADVLRYSPRCLKRIAHFIRGRDAFIIPGYVGPRDWLLAHRLGVPMLGFSSDFTTAYSTKTGARRLFAASDVSVAPGSCEFESIEALHGCISRFILEHIDATRFMIKIDNESSGRGLAVLDAADLKSVLSLRKERQRNLAAWFDPVKQGAALRRVEEEVGCSRYLRFFKVKRRLVEVAVVARGDVFPNFSSFQDVLLKFGGVIELMPENVVGCPGANIFVHPSGHVEIRSTFDSLRSQAFAPLGVACPQSSTQHIAIAQAAMAVGKQINQRGAFGFATLQPSYFFDSHSQFVSWLDTNGDERLWGIDLDTAFTDAAASCDLFLFLSGGSVGASDGRVMVDPPPDILDAPSAPRYCVSLDYLYHTNLASVQYNVFFNLCRLKGVHFDLRERCGSAFLLLDSFSGGTVGMTCLAKSTISAIKTALDGLEFIHSHLGVGKGSNEKFLQLHITPQSQPGLFKDAVIELKHQLQVRSNAAEATARLQAQENLPLLP